MMVSGPVAEARGGSLTPNLDQDSEDLCAEILGRNSLLHPGSGHGCHRITENEALLK